MIELDAFLTAYDPSDLPSTSIDPMGFERGYLFLADKLLPALTNVAAVPRYLSVLCAGVHLAPVPPNASTRAISQLRRESVMRLERLWALANYLAAQKAGGRPSGLRGISYVAAEVARLEHAGTSEVDPEYKLLSRQAPYGLLGIYGTIAESLRLVVDRTTMELSPDAGKRLAEAFCDETALTSKLMTSVKTGAAISIQALTKWGEAAPLLGPYGVEESSQLHEALVRDPVRARMCELLARRPARDDEAELDRLADIEAAVTDADADLRDAIRTVRAFEDAYAWVLLGFERLLWLCRNSTGSDVVPAARAKDPVLSSVADELPAVAEALERALQDAATAHVGASPSALSDVRAFLRVAAACDDGLALSEALLDRHAAVQAGKFDRGKRKLAWIERTTSGLALAMTRVGGAAFELKSPTQIRPHFYRLAAADAFVSAGTAS